MLCVRDKSKLCEYNDCEYYNVKAEQCGFENYFPLWMRQLVGDLKHEKRLAQFGSIKELAEGYLKLIVR